MPQSGWPASALPERHGGAAEALRRTVLWGTQWGQHEWSLGLCPVRRGSRGWPRGPPVMGGVLSFRESSSTVPSGAEGLWRRGSHPSLPGSGCPKRGALPGVISG